MTHLCLFTNRREILKFASRPTRPKLPARLVTVLLHRQSGNNHVRDIPSSLPFGNERRSRRRRGFEESKNPEPRISQQHQPGGQSVARDPRIQRQEVRTMRFGCFTACTSSTRRLVVVTGSQGREDHHFCSAAGRRLNSSRVLMVGAHLHRPTVNNSTPHTPPSSTYALGDHEGKWRWNDLFRSG